jgi:hypothetical protein
MRRLPFFIALAMGLSTAAFTLGSNSLALAQEAGVAETAEQATDATNDAADAASEAANDATEATSDAATEAADTASDTTSSATDTANEAVDATTDAANQAVPSSGAQTPAGSAEVDANLSGRNPGNVQGSIGARSQLDAQGRPLPNPNTNVGAQGQLNAGVAANGQQSAQVQANGPLSAGAIDQRLGLQFAPTARTIDQGLAISTIQPNSVFYNSGLRQGDVLVSVDNRPFTNRAEFVRLITSYQQDRIPLVVLRNGQRQTIYFSRPADFVIHDHQSSEALLGVSFDSSRGGAAVVRAVTPDSPAEHIGLMTGDVITGINGRPILAAHEVAEAIDSMHPGQEVTIDYSRNQLKLRAETFLAARTEPHRHRVGYAPQPSVEPVPLPTPVGPPVIREDTTYRAQPTSPGDPDGDGLRLDGDGRIPRRALNRR